MPVNLQKSPEERIEQLLERNLKLNEEMHKMVKSIRNYVIGQRIWFVLKMLFIVIPLIIGFIYLPPLFKNLFAQYQSLVGGLNETSGNLQGILKGDGGVELPAGAKNLLK